MAIAFFFRMRFRRQIAGILNRVLRFGLASHTFSSQKHLRQWSRPLIRLSSESSVEFRHGSEHETTLSRKSVDFRVNPLSAWRLQHFQAIVLTVLSGNGRFQRFPVF